MDILAVQEKMNNAMETLKLTILKDADLAFLKEYTICLKPFAYVIQSLQGEKKHIMGYSSLN